MRNSRKHLITTLTLISGLLAAPVLYAQNTERRDNQHSQGESSQGGMGQGGMMGGMMGPGIMGHGMMEQMNKMMENCNKMMEASLAKRGESETPSPKSK